MLNLGPSAWSRLRVSICLLTLLMLCLRSAPPVDAQEATFRIRPSVSPAVSAEIQRIFSQSLEFESADLGVTLSRPVTVFIYGSQREIFEGLVDELGFPEVEARAVAAGASFFVMGNRLFLNAGEPLFVDPPRLVDRTRTIAHELAHIIHNDLMADGSAAPLWIREGFAVRMELRTADHLGFHPTARGAQEDLNLTLFVFRRKALIPLAELDRRARWDEHIQQEGPDRVYAQVFVAVDYLTQTRGQQAVLAYFRTFQTSRDADANFARAFGLTVEAFNHEFESYLASQSR